MLRESYVKEWLIEQVNLPNGTFIVPDFLRIKVFFFTENFKLFGDKNVSSFITNISGYVQKTFPSICR